MIPALALFGLTIVAILYLLHVGGKLKKTEYLENDLDAIHKANTARRDVPKPSGVCDPDDIDCKL